jgi:hypothetical protein
LRREFGPYGIHRALSCCEHKRAVGASFREKGSKALGFTMASFVLARAEKVIE